MTYNKYSQMFDGLHKQMFIFVTQKYVQDGIWLILAGFV